MLSSTAFSKLPIHLPWQDQPLVELMFTIALLQAAQLYHQRRHRPQPRLLLRHPLPLHRLLLSVAKRQRSQAIPIPIRLEAGLSLSPGILFQELPIIECKGKIVVVAGQRVQQPQQPVSLAQMH